MAKSTQMMFWTLADLENFTAVQLDTVCNGQMFCMHCMVIPAVTEHGMCARCDEESVNTMCNSLAAQFTQQGQVEKGLY